MFNLLDKYHKAIGIFLVLVILTGGAGIIYKETQRVKGSEIQKIENKEINKEEQKEKVEFKININQATKEELDALPGIGQVKAQSIVDYREKNGHFNKKEDIIKVKGIGEKTYEKIKNLIEVN